MGHEHGHGLDEVRSKGTRSIFIALCITLVFVLTQVVGGLISGSLALLADAAHMATDAISYVVALFAFWIAKRPASLRMSFGYYRAEILGAALSCLMLWAICGFLIYEAIRRMFAPPEVKGGLVFIIACITLVFNLITMAILYRSSKESLNVKAAFLHALSDLLGNFGVLLAGGLIYLTGWYIVDPILTILFTALILFSSWRMLTEATEILMQASPRQIDPMEVQEALIGLPGVQEVHDLHIWTVSSSRFAMSAHLVSPDPVATLQEAVGLVKKKFNISHCTLQVEKPEEFQRDLCYDIE
jgi:cobalt-zinc-cadmium efflux system protein